MARPGNNRAPTPSTAAVAVPRWITGEALAAIDALEGPGGGVPADGHATMSMSAVIVICPEIAMGLRRCGTAQSVRFSSRRVGRGGDIGFGQGGSGVCGDAFDVAALGG
jgi:hypothetical protein